jgi:hypothetical protein
MKSTAEACAILARLEGECDLNDFRIGEIGLWPLLRHVLWIELLRTGSADGQHVPTASARLFSKTRRLSEVWCQKIVHPFLENRADVSRASVLFVSRPVYLQHLGEANLYFDRIIDPLLFIARNHHPVAKAYIGHVPGDRRLFFPGFPLLRRMAWHRMTDKNSISRWVKDIAHQAGLNDGQLLLRFLTALNHFEGWYRAGRSLFISMPQVKRLYLTSWYFPDMMGLTASAKEAGIDVIDVQHGKQGKYQGMYSWWTRIPQDGYRMMPDRFWCWGRPSCEDILRTSPNRTTHRPFIGGYPWIDWYRTFINMEAARPKAGRTILFTLQGPQGKSEEPIPDFIVSFLKDDRYSDWLIRFRNHPNFTDGLDYCARRLSSVDRRRFEIADQNRNLYDEFLGSTHHITGYSSCCYEAESFGVPTLLFGDEAQSIYETDIARGRFAWTCGVTSDLIAWLEQSSSKDVQHSDQYIESSLSLASSMLEAGLPV